MRQLFLTLLCTLCSLSGFAPRYLSLDLQSYSFSKDRVRVVTSIGLALVQGHTDENKE